MILATLAPVVAESTGVGDWLDARLSSPAQRNEERRQRAAALYSQALAGDAAALAELIRLAEHFATQEGKEYARAYLRQYYQTTGTVPDPRVGQLIGWTGQTATGSQSPIQPSVPGTTLPAGAMSAGGGGFALTSNTVAVLVLVALAFVALRD